MKQIKTILASAVLAGLAVQAMAASTNEWFSFDFETGAQGDYGTLTNANGLVDAQNELIGTWVHGDGDVSDVSVPAFPENYADGKGLRLNTQGSDLTFTPANASTGTVVLVDADVYLVGSDSAPKAESFDNDALNPVQTAVFLRNQLDADGDTTNSVLSAYVRDTGAANKWIDLKGITMVDTNWYHVRVEIEYRGTAEPPLARYYVNGHIMTDGAETAFVIANAATFTAQGNGNVKSVAFRGTGNVDNFVGRQVTPDLPPELTFAYETYVNGTLDANVPIAPSDAEAAIALSYDGNFISAIRITDGEDELVYNWDFSDYDGGIAYDFGAKSNGQLIEEAGDGLLAFDTTGFPAGQVTVLIYYGTSGSSTIAIPDPYLINENGMPVLVIGGAYDENTLWPDGAPSVEVIDGNFVVRVVSADPNVTYSLVKDVELGDGWADEDIADTATGVAKGALVELTAPMDQDGKAFFKVKAEWVHLDE